MKREQVNCKHYKNINWLTGVCVICLRSDIKLSVYNIKS